MQKSLIVLLTGLFLAVGSSLFLGKGEVKKELPGKTTYTTYCFACHGATGMGDGPAGKVLKPPPTNFADKEKMKKLTDDYLFQIIKNGGAKVGKSPLMAPWGGVLKDPQIKDLVEYIRTFSK